MDAKQLLNLAIEIEIEWGPDARRPVVDRICERAPGVGPEEAAELKSATAMRSRRSSSFP